MSKDTGGPATAHEAFARALEEAAKACETGRGDWYAATLACATAIRAIKNPYPASEWVKVSERLPEVNATVLCYWPAAIMKNEAPQYVAMFDGKHWHNADDPDDLYSNPAYWTPLHTPPEEKP